MAGDPLTAVGAVLGGFRIQEALGFQGMAERFRVSDSNGNEFAMGVVTAHHAELSSRLVDLASRIPDNPHLPQVQALVSVGRMPGIVTDAAFGPTLDHWLVDAEPSAEARLEVFRGICEGVSAGHAAGLVHLDLRPQNILVAQGDKAIVHDFGVAYTVFQLVGEGKSVTTSGQTIGRPHYWSPERARRPHCADHRADVFSLGCILYEMLAGVGPYAGLNLYDCFHATVAERYVPLPERVPNVRPELAELVRLALSADLEARLDNSQAFLEYFEVRTRRGAAPQRSAADPGQPTRLVSHGPVQQVSLSARVAAFAAGAVMVAALIGALVWWWLG